MYVILNILDKPIALETLVGSNGEKQRCCATFTLCAIIPQVLEHTYRIVANSNARY